MSNLDQIPPERHEALRKEDQGPLIIRMTVSFTVLAFFTVVLRCFTRIKLSRNWGMEDGFIVLSMAFSIVMAACQIMQVKYGSGRHSIFFTSTDQLISFIKYIYFAVIAYRTSICLTRVSILLQYLRIFTLREMRIPIYIVMAICVGFGITSVSIDAFGCRPIDAFWNVRKRPTATCIDHVAVSYANAGINVFCDLLVAALPVKAVWNLPLPIKQKAAVLVILTLGWFVCIVSILRLHSLVVLAHHRGDSSWYAVPWIYWSSVENNLAIVCASVPVLKPLVVRIGRSRRVNNSDLLVMGVRERKQSLPLRNKISPEMMDVGKLSHAFEADDDQITVLPSAHHMMTPIEDEYHKELREELWRSWDQELRTKDANDIQKDLVSMNEANHRRQQ